MSQKSDLSDNNKSPAALVAKIFGIIGIALLIASCALYMSVPLILIPIGVDHSIYMQVLEFELFIWLEIAGFALLGVAFLLFGIIRKDTVLKGAAIPAGGAVIARLPISVLSTIIPNPFANAQLPGFTLLLLLSFIAISAVVYLHARSKYESQKIQGFIAGYLFPGSMFFFIIISIYTNFSASTAAFTLPIVYFSAYYFLALLFIWSIKQDRTPKTVAERVYQKRKAKVQKARDKEEQKKRIVEEARKRRELAERELEEARVREISVLK